MGRHIYQRPDVHRHRCRRDGKKSIHYSFALHIQRYIAGTHVSYCIILYACVVSIVRVTDYSYEKARAKKKSVTHAGNQKHVQIYTEGVSYTLTHYINISAMSSRIYRRCVADKNFS